MCTLKSSKLLGWLVTAVAEVYLQFPPSPMGCSPYSNTLCHETSEPLPTKARKRDYLSCLRQPAEQMMLTPLLKQQQEQRTVLEGWRQFHSWPMPERFKQKRVPAAHSRLLVPEKQQVERNVKGVSLPHLSGSNHYTLQRGMENLLHPEVEGKWLWLPGE